MKQQKLICQSADDNGYSHMYSYLDSKAVLLD